MAGAQMNWMTLITLCGCMATQSLGAGLTMCLNKMEEKNLAISPTNSFSFRFTLIPTRGNPVCIRVEQQGNVLKLVAKRLDGQGGYKIGDLVETKKRTLSAKDSKEIVERADKLRVFELPMRTDEDGGHDGERWFLEGSRYGKFHRTERWSPRDNTKKRGLNEFVGFCALL